MKRGLCQMNGGQNMGKLRSTGAVSNMSGPIIAQRQFDR